MSATRPIAPFVYEGRPQRVLFGPGRLAEAPEVVRALGVGRALVLSTPEQKESAEHVAGILGGLAVGHFFGATMHTPIEVTEQAIAIFDEHEADCVVAMGGGSTTGLAKAIALRTDAPQLIVPTTYAGSEVTPVLGETAEGEKQTIRSPKVVPDAVIYDVELTLSLPPQLSATSGMNAMAHAVEALFAKDRNPVVEMMAAEGLRAFASALPVIVGAPQDIEARTSAQYGAWLCGMCLASTSMALHHKLCHVLGGAFNLPHAETHAIVLPHALAYNAPAVPEAMNVVAAALGADDAAGGLYALVQSLNIPLSLKEIGMPEDGIDQAVAMTIRDSYWNPLPLDVDGLRALLRHAYEGAAPAA